MNERGLSVYGLFLLVDDLSKATIYRWFNGTSRIDVNRAVKLLEALAGEDRSVSLGAAEALLAREGAGDSARDRLRGELKARKLPRNRTFDALRAAGVPGFE
ncbi:MAG: helix-turn-helix domain-containing protein [bacterium]|nr:helix-turn-helix domain-containing protein [bacterium]